MVHVGAELLAGVAGAGAASAGACHLERGPGLSPEVVRRLACDGAIRLVARGAKGTPMDVGRASRVIPARLRRALEIRDQGTCRFPGCTNTRFVDAHHVRHWARGGGTDLANLLTLCTAHHRAVHEGGFSLSYDSTTDAVSGRRPDGRPIPQAPIPPAMDTNMAGRRWELEVPVTTATTAAACALERMDYGLAVDAWLCLDGLWWGGQVTTAVPGSTQSAA